MEKINEIQCEANFDLSEKLFESKCAINSKRIKVLTSAIRKLGNIVKINEIIKAELDLLNKLDTQEKNLKNMTKMLK